MLTESAFNEYHYEQFTRKTPNYKQTLWQVEDSELYRPGERFIAETSPYVEAIMEQGSGPLENSVVPEGLVAFVQNFVQKLGVDSSENSTVSSVVHYVLQFLDYEEPYFLFVDMPVQIKSNQLVQTYRHKKSRSALNPEEVETFQVAHGWDFKPYKQAVALLEHPVTKQILRGEKVLSAEGKELSREDIVEKLSIMLWGPPGHLTSHVEDWLYRYYADLPSNSPNMEDINLQALEACQRHDMKFWEIASVGCLMWFKSPHALGYLVDYHPIYSAVLQWNKEDRQFQILPSSGGEAVVWGWDVYNHSHLIIEKNEPPGTCESCKVTLHCTKFLNATALFHPVCSCGKPIDPEDTRGWQCGYGKDCEKYKKEHPAFDAFVCQRCIQMALTDPNNRMRKCDRMQCPAFKCPHHAGQAAYIAHLTEKRRLQLTHQPH